MTRDGEKFFLCSSPIALPIIIFVASFALYLSTLAPGMLRGDSGEFQWAMASLNVAHATGYPLFTLLGYVWLKLPLAGDVAWRLNLLSAIFGAGAVTMVFIFARAITQRQDAALIGTIFFALAPIFWFNASILEVYTLNAFFLALILYLLWRWSHTPQTNRLLYLAFIVLGLTLAHHRLTILALPGIFIFLWLTERRFLGNRCRLITLALSVVPGLLLYIYVPLRLLPAGATLHYAIFDIILGQEFSGSLFHEFHFAPVFWEIPTQNFHIGLILAALGIAALWQRARNLNVLLILVCLTNIAFALVYSVPDLQVFLTPSFVILALWIAMGAQWLLESFAARVRPALIVRTAALLLIILPLVGLGQYSKIHAQVKAEAGTEEKRARAILAANLPQGTLLELDWETATALRFLQATEGTRRDLEPRLLKVNARDEYFRVLQNVDAGRAVYIERGVKWTRAVAGYRVESALAGLAQITRENIQAQSLNLKIDDRVALAAMRTDEHAVKLYWQVSRPLTRDLATFIHYFDTEGQPLGQEDHGACCEAIYGYRTSEWEMGREIAESFRPVPPRTNYLQVGMYTLNGDDIESYGQTLHIQTAPIVLSANAQSLDILLNDGIRAHAYEINRDGTNLKLTLYWEVNAQVKKDYTVFVHLLDASGKILQQTDREPLNGIYPTHTWQPGQIVRDMYILPATNGGVKLEFGMYDSTNSQRLERADGQGTTLMLAVPF